VNRWIVIAGVLVALGAAGPGMPGPLKAVRAWNLTPNPQDAEHPLTDNWTYVADEAIGCGSALQAGPDNGHVYAKAALTGAPRIDEALDGLRKWQVVTLTTKGVAGGNTLWWRLGSTGAPKLLTVPVGQWTEIPLAIVQADGMQTLSIWPNRDGVTVDSAYAYGPGRARGEVMNRAAVAHRRAEGGE
jgi:hypothetical protein